GAEPHGPGPAPGARGRQGGRAARRGRIPEESRDGSGQADLALDALVPVAEQPGLHLVAVVVDDLDDHALALDLVLLALGGLLAHADGVVELLLVDLAVVA